MHFGKVLGLAGVIVLSGGVALAQEAGAGQSAPVAAAAAPAATRPAGDLVGVLRADGRFTTLLKTLDATNLTSVLTSNPNLTLLAPTDSAFAALPPGELDRLMLPENRADLQKRLTYHIINTRVDASKIKGAKGPVPSVAGPGVEFDGTVTPFLAADAKILTPELTASNGVILPIDRLLSLPSGAGASGPAQAKDAN